MWGSHPPLRLCRPPPELLGQRDVKLNGRAEASASARVVPGALEPKLVRKPGFAPGPSRSQRGMLLLHHNPDLKWSPGSDSHRRLRVYETRPVASEARGLSKWCPRQESHLRPSASQAGALISLSYADNWHP